MNIGDWNNDLGREEERELAVKLNALRKVNEPAYIQLAFPIVRQLDSELLDQLRLYEEENGPLA
jgi:hypothetical protein